MGAAERARERLVAAESRAQCDLADGQVGQSCVAAVRKKPLNVYRIVRICTSLEDICKYSAINVYIKYA
jgi:hypothetical protein